MPSNGRICFVDLDGVVADFVGSVLKLHDLDPDDILPKMEGSYDIQNLLGLSTSEFWGVIDKDFTFWENLPLLPDAKQLMNALEERYKEIYFLSSPSLSPACHFGKATWVAEHFPKYQNKLILTGHKHLLAKKDRILIDDSDKNINRFKAAGGHVLLYPRPWNSKHHLSSTAFQNFKGQLRFL
jgi:5'(3')-deoxyribonucleotidase